MLFRSPLDAPRVNYGGAIGHVTPVGLFPKGNTSEGLCDMLGNVWEWCGDWFGRYGTEHLQNPCGPKEGDAKILRGGAWDNNPRNVRVSFRAGYGPAFRISFFGFRCAGE